MNSESHNSDSISTSSSEAMAAGESMDSGISPGFETIQSSTEDNGANNTDPVPAVDPPQASTAPDPAPETICETAAESASVVEATAPDPVGTETTVEKTAVAEAAVEETAAVETEPAIDPTPVVEPVTEQLATAAPTPAAIPPNPPAPVALDPAIAERIEIPASTSQESETSGGEWELLTSKLGDWWQNNDFDAQVNNLRQPLRILGILIAVGLVLKVYTGLLGAIGSIPLAPRLLELVGLYWVVHFSTTRLVRSDERSKVIQSVQERWTSFTGKS